MIMKYVEKLRARGVTAESFAKKLGKCKAWGAQIYRGRNSKGDVFLLHPRYYSPVKEIFPYIKDRDFF